MTFCRFTLFTMVLLTGSIFAQAIAPNQSTGITSDLAQGKQSMHPTPRGGFLKKGNLQIPAAFPAGVDTIPTFTGHFEAQGVDLFGNPQHIWEYVMIGGDPAHGGTTMINAPIIPIRVDLREADGSPRFFNGHRLIAEVDPLIPLLVNSPVFAYLNYTSSDEPTQFTDAVHRAEFGNRASSDWHTLLNPVVLPTRTMVLLPGTYSFQTNADGSCCAFVLVDIDEFLRQMFPATTAPDDSTIMGQAIKAGEISTKDLTTFFFPNAFVFLDHDPVNGCCASGFHDFVAQDGDSSNGYQPKFYVFDYAAWASQGPLGIRDREITPFNHEVAEAFDDPFVAFDNIHNMAPWYQTPDGFCSDFLETGDVMFGFGEDALFPITINGFTYHTQKLALLPWFEGAKNSFAFDNAYSYPGTTVFTAPSPQNLPVNCGQ